MQHCIKVMYLLGSLSVHFTYAVGYVFAHWGWYEDVNIIFVWNRINTRPFVCVCKLLLVISANLKSCNMLYYALMIRWVSDIIETDNDPLPLSGLIQQTTNWYFSYFSQKTGFEISCKLSPVETICMKCQTLFSGKSKKNISKFCLLEILLRVLSINLLGTD